MTTPPSNATSPLDFHAPFDGALTDDLAFALELVAAADAVTMARFDSADLDVQTKADASFVTEADLAAEKVIRELIAAERPDDAVFGEEFGSSGEASRQWIIDPIDGTSNYLKGLPMWATLIALAIDGVPRVGVVSQPAIGRRWWASSGGGAWTNGPDGALRRISVSGVDTVAQASVSFQSITQWVDAGYRDALLALAEHAWRDRGYGDAWPYMMLAEGRLEVVGEFDIAEYDIAAHVPIILEAGGRFTDIDGADSVSSRSALATNGVVHDAVLDLIRAHRS